jgi:phosphohistidine phosphatase
MSAGQKIILVRHGEATKTVENPERPLTIVGRQHAEWAATWLERCGYEIGEIRHSKKLRARETAEILGKRLGMNGARVRRVSGLRAHDDPAALAMDLEAEDRSLMLVGHLPFLARLAGILLIGDPDRVGFRFTDAGVLVLGRDRGAWRVEALVGSDGV